VRPAWIIAQRVHLGATSADHVQQIRQRDTSTVFLDQRSLTVLASSPALRARQPHHCSRVLGKAERSIGHGVMLLAGAVGTKNAAQSQLARRLPDGSWKIHVTMFNSDAA